VMLTKSNPYVSYMDGAGFSLPEFSKMPIALKASAVALAGGLFFASFSPAFSQSQGGEQKPADAPSAEQQAQEAARQRSIKEFTEAAKLPKNAGLPECVWTGRRIASLLWRDDVDTAKRYIDVYERFSCPADHLKLAFRCVVRQGQMDQKAAEKLAARVHACWINPDTQAPTLGQ
jgi:hypothetical protein